jgi:hypothetical protein
VITAPYDLLEAEIPADLKWDLLLANLIPTAHYISNRLFRSNPGSMKTFGLNGGIVRKQVVDLPQIEFNNFQAVQLLGKAKTELTS